MGNLNRLSMNYCFNVIPAKVGIYKSLFFMDTCFRRHNKI